MGYLTYGKRPCYVYVAFHYFYMREVWVSTGDTPTDFRYIDWLLTVPLLMIEFYLICRPSQKSLVVSFGVC